MLSPNGSDLAHGRGVAPQVVDYSSRLNTNSAYDPNNAVDFNTDSYWRSGQDQPDNQWIKLWLLDGRSWLVDTARLRGTNNSSVKDFEIRVSNAGPDDDDFVTVYSGTLPPDNNDHWFTFPPVYAKYIQLVALNNHGNCC